MVQSEPEDTDSMMQLISSRTRFSRPPSLPPPRSSASVRNFCVARGLFLLGFCIARDEAARCRFDVGRKMPLVEIKSSQLPTVIAAPQHGYSSYTFFEPPPGEDEIVYGARKNSKQSGSVCYGSSIVLLLTLGLMTVLSACFFVLDRSSLLHVWEKSRGSGSESGHSRIGNLTASDGNFSTSLLTPKF